MVRQEERRAATLAAILAAAEHLFGEQGYEATSVDAIAARARVAKGAVYHHFQRKQDVFEAVFELVSSRLAQTLAEEVRGDLGVIDQLVASTHRYFQLCGDATVARITLRDAPAVLGHERWRELDEAHFGGSMIGAFRHAVAVGAIRAMPADALAKMVLAAIQTAALDCAQSENFAEAAEPYLASLEAMLAGLVSKA